MAKATKEALIVAYSGAAARTSLPAYDPKAAPGQVAQATNNSRAAERNLERLRTGRIE